MCQGSDPIHHCCYRMEAATLQVKHRPSREGHHREPNACASAHKAVAPSIHPDRHAPPPAAAPLSPPPQRRVKHSPSTVVRWTGYWLRCWQRCALHRSVAAARRKGVPYSYGPMIAHTRKLSSRRSASHSPGRQDAAAPLDPLAVDRYQHGCNLRYLTLLENEIPCPRWARHSLRSEMLCAILAALAGAYRPTGQI